MEHYVTLFDFLFLPQGLALHMSMQRNIKNYTLWVLCVDDETFKILNSLSLSNIRLLQLSQLETAELLSIKSTRSKGEYCWTLTPFAPRFVFEADSEVKRVTYLDADLWFRKSPQLIFEEFEASKKNILITEHAYAPEYDYSSSNGKYCVQFMTFTRSGGEVVRKWWEDRCIEWCYARVEEGKFGDQKYLDEWPRLFSELVHVLKRKYLALGPWNAIIYPSDKGVFYHFHGLRIVEKKRIVLSGYKLPKPYIENLYKPYINDLSYASKFIDIKIQKKLSWWRYLHYIIKGRIFKLI